MPLNWPPGPRPGCERRWQQDQVPFILGAAVSTQSEVHRGAAALALPEGHSHRGLQRSAGRSAGAGCRGPFGFDDHASKATWWEEYEAWRKRDLSGKRYVYIWADGVYFTPRLDGDRQCMLVIIGADEYGEKDVLAIMDGFRENADSWRDLPGRLKKRGMTVPPQLAIGDGALGFWTALRDVFPTIREQRCWVHKTANVTGAMPKSLREKAKSDLQDIWLAETGKEANAAFDLFVETYGVKYERAVTKLVKDRDELLVFYDFPAEHWKHIRTTNPIESVFATVRNRTRKTKGCLNRKTTLAMVFRLMMSARKKWRKISGPNRLPELIQGVEFKDGVKQRQAAAVTARLPIAHRRPIAAGRSSSC